MKKLDVIQPTYINRFACLGSQCKYNCCQEWNIFLSRSEYTKIKSQIHSKEMEEAFCAAFVRQKGQGGDNSKYASVRYNSSNVCPLQNKEGMCSLQLQCGHQALPVTCQTFPRTEALLLGTLERHLSLGCEVVVKLLLEEQQGICLETSRISPHRGNRRILQLITDQDVDKRPIYQYIWDIKTLCVAVLQDRSRTLDDRMLFLGVMLSRLRRMEQENRTEQIPAFVDEILRSQDDYINLKDWESMDTNPAIPVINALFFFNQLRTGSNNRHLEDMVKQILKNFEVVIGNDWEIQEGSRQAITNLNVNQEKNQEIQKKYAQWLAKYEYFVENIMVAWLFHSQVPFAQWESDIWEQYIYFCSLYNLLKIILMGTVAEPECMDQVIHNVTVCGRILTHSAVVPQTLIKRAVESGSDTLAHMAILIKS